MADVKWIKLNTDMFDNAKTKFQSWKAQAWLGYASFHVKLD